MGACSSKKVDCFL